MWEGDSKLIWLMMDDDVEMHAFSDRFQCSCNQGSCRSRMRLYNNQETNRLFNLKQSPSDNVMLIYFISIFHINTLNIGDDTSYPYLKL